VKKRGRTCGLRHQRKYQRAAEARIGGRESVGAVPKSEKDKMLARELYRASDPEIQRELAATAGWLARYNVSLPLQRRSLLIERFASVGEDVELRPPFFCDCGFNISIGSGVFLNFNCVILDVVAVTIGDRSQIGPGVHIYAADHPRDSKLRSAGLELGRPVVIGQNVWIGGNAVILPGVTVGDDAIVGAGAVVTRDVPDNVTVAGNPARIAPGSRRQARDEF
jgi:maltose O-acetyltransferase